MSTKHRAMPNPFYGVDILRGMILKVVFYRTGRAESFHPRRAPRHKLAKYISLTAAINVREDASTPLFSDRCNSLTNTKVEFPLIDGYLPQRTSAHRVEHKSGWRALDLQAAVFIVIPCHASATLSGAWGKHAAESRLFQTIHTSVSRPPASRVARPSVYLLSYS